MEPFQCARCEHWCEHGIIYNVKDADSTLFRCSECHHATTIIHSPQEQE